MSVALMSPETASNLSQAAVALLGASVVLAIFAVTAVALSTAFHLHRHRDEIARLRFGESNDRKPR